MARPAHEPAPIPDEPPLVDADSVERAYHLHRAQRRARIEHRRHTRRARLRYFAAILVLVTLTVFLVLFVWHEIQSLFGL